MSPIRAIVGTILVLALPAAAQENHAVGHGHYRNWVNKEGTFCCNDRDCGQLTPDDERTVDGRLEVRVEGKWCPIHPYQYLRTGRSPNWETAHICVRDWKTTNAGIWSDPCVRILCYLPRPLS